MQGIRSSNSRVITGICDLNKSHARHHCNFSMCSTLESPIIGGVGIIGGGGGGHCNHY